MSAVQSMVVIGHVYIFNFLSNNFSTTNQSFIQPMPNSTEIPTITESLIRPIPNSTEIPTIAESLTQLMPATTPEPRLRSDYTYTPGSGAHKAYKSDSSWNKARLHCEEDGAYLAIINSPAEMEAIAKLLNTSDIWISWIGAHDFYEEGQFVTIHGESLATAGFAEWESGEPNNRGGSEDCVIATSLGKLNDMDCVNGHYYTCELSL